MFRLHVSAIPYFTSCFLPASCPKLEADGGAQIPITAGLFFAAATRLWILKIRFARFEGDTTWEVDNCPHLHGNFGADDVVAVEAFERADGQEWGQVLGSSTFLV